MKRNDLLLILIPTLFFVIFWVGFNIFHNFQSSTISGAVNTQIIPITPSFDTKTIDLINSRTQVNFNFQSTISTPSAIPTTPVAITPTGTVNPQQASAGGSLTP